MHRWFDHTVVQDLIGPRIHHVITLMKNRMRTWTWRLRSFHGRAIKKCCGTVPDYVREIARWCQIWFQVLPERFDFMLPCSRDGGLTRSDQLWQKAPEVFNVMFGSPEAMSDRTHATPYGIWGNDSGLFAHDQFLVLWGGVAQQSRSMGSKIVFGAFEYWSPPIGYIESCQLDVVPTSM